jgi:hypothetical protein
MSVQWNQRLSGVAWELLATELRRHLRGARRFGVQRTTPGHVVIAAHYDGAPPAIEAFEVSIDGVRLTVEVVTYRKAAPSPTAKGNPGFTGLHPGAAIAARISSTTSELGGVAVLLQPHSGGNPTHLLTCGHLFPPRAGEVAVFAAKSPSSPRVRIGMLVRNLLDADNDPPRDVAVVALTPDGVAMAFAGGPGPVIGDYLPDDDVFDQTARAFQPTRANYSSTTHTTGPFDEHVDSPLWPGGFDVSGVVGTDAAVCVLGDSGTVLATLDDPAIAVGVCSASDGDMSLFEPVGRVLRAIANMELQLWSP